MQLARKSSSQNLDVYLQIMEKEKQRQRKRILIGGLIGGALLLVLVPVLWFSLKGETTDTREAVTYLMFQQEYLPHDQIFSYLAKPQHAVVIMDESMEAMDTVSSAVAYQYWLEQHPEIQGYQPTMVATSNLDTTESQLPDVQTSPMGLILRGNLVADKLLTFVVSGYNADFSYQLSLGDGQVKKINSRYTHRYKSSGTFTVKLKATDPEGNSRTIQRQIDIKLPPAPDEQIASTDDAAAQGENETEQTLIITQDDTPPLPAVAEPDPTQLASIDQLDNLPNTTLTREAPASEQESRSEAPAEPNSAQSSNLDLANHIFPSTEEPASFPGGFRAMRRFLTRNMLYPPDAEQNNIEGTVTVRFVVNQDGSLTEPVIIKRLGHGCEEEVMRVLSKMPNWEPGKIGGQVVRSYFVLPVNFEMR